jgi:hypothetical protein
LATGASVIVASNWGLSLGALTFSRLTVTMGRSKTVTVYRYKRRWAAPEYLPEWGTRDAISAIECIPLRQTERSINAAYLDVDGFLPYGLTPDDVAN